MDLLRPFEGISEYVEKKRGIFGDSSKVIVYSNSTSNRISFQKYLHYSHGLQNCGLGDIIIIPVNTERKKVRFGISMDDFRLLGKSWKIPYAAIKYFLTNSVGSSGQYQQTCGGSRFSWFSLPINGIASTFSWLEDHTRVLNFFDISPEKNISCTLLGVPVPLIKRLTDFVENYQQSLAFDLCSHLETLRFQTLLIELSVSSIDTLRLVWMINTQNLVGVIDEVIRTTFNSNWLFNCDSLISKGKMHLSHLSMSKRNLTRIMEDLTHLASDRETDNTLTLKHAMSAIHEDIEGNEKWFNQGLGLLQDKREKIYTMVNIRNARFILNNTIAYRRIVQQNDEGNKNVQELAMASRKDAEEMRKLAYLTMIYMPGNFIATVFSMPFFELEKGVFSHNIKHVWIYFTISGTLTALTFLVFWSWDSLQRCRKSMFHKSQDFTSNTAADDDISSANPDLSSLEPEVAQEPDMNEILESFIEEHLNSIVTIQDVTDHGSIDSNSTASSHSHFPNAEGEPQASTEVADTRIPIIPGLKKRHTRSSN